MKMTVLVGSVQDHVYDMLHVKLDDDQVIEPA